MGSRTTSSFAYPVDLKQDEDGRFVARLPDLVGAVTDGNNRAEALREASGALEEAIAACMASHEDIARPWPPLRRTRRPDCRQGGIVRGQARGGYRQCRTWPPSGRSRKRNPALP